MNRIRTGIFGCGKVGHLHAQALKNMPESNFTAVCGRDINKTMIRQPDVLLFLFASRMDIDDYNRDAREGLHVTSMAATWMNIVYGFGGMRSDGEKLVFNPTIPRNWKSFSFNILYRGTRLNIKISRQSVILKACTGPSVSVKVFEKEYLVDSDCIELKLPAERLG